MPVRQSIAAKTSAPPQPRDMGNFWRLRLTAAVDQLEKEARRLLQLEEELGAFATRYYDAIEAAVLRLDALEQQLPDEEAPDLTPEWNDIVTQCSARASRRKELSLRYRTLARDIHPDRAMLVEGVSPQASQMQRLNVAQQKGDLAALLRLEAELMVGELNATDTTQLEIGLYEIKRAAETYAESYRTLLGSPLNTLMLRAMSARLAGWDWIESVQKKIERRIEEKEHAIMAAFDMLDQNSEWPAPLQVM